MPHVENQVVKKGYLTETIRQLRRIYFILAENKNKFDNLKKKTLLMNLANKINSHSWMFLWSLVIICS